MKKTTTTKKKWKKNKNKQTTTMFDGYIFMVLPYNGKESNVDGKKEDNENNKNKNGKTMFFFCSILCWSCKSFSEWCWMIKVYVLMIFSSVTNSLIFA